MKENKFVLGALVLVMLIPLFGCSSKKNNSASQNPEDVFVSAKTDSYASVKELEDASDLIVIGTKLNELKSDVVYDENGVYQIAYTYSSFQIDETISNKINESNQKITIFENQAYDKESNQVLHIAGYTNMVNGNKYILYLKSTSDNYYVPLAVNFGKVPLTSSEINGPKLKMKNSDDAGTEIIQKLQVEIQKKYERAIN